jgi:hypothetical protein
MPKTKPKKLVTRKQGQAFLKAIMPVSLINQPVRRPQPPKGRGRRGR